MNKRELEELRDWEYVLLQSERIATQAKKKLIEAFKLDRIDYDSDRDELLYISEYEDDYLGVRFETKNHIDEMLVDIDVEE